MLQQRKQEIITKVQQCIARGNELYGITLPNLGIRFDLKGRAAGMACKRGSQYYLRFNTDMMTREAWDHIINNTVPHEVAHSFCQFNRALGSNHDAGWARVCRALGGTGETRHKEEVVYGKGTTYEYTTDRGHKVRMSDKHHAVVQAGHPLIYRKGLGKVTKECAYSIVGVQGRTLALPVVRVPVATVPTVQATITAPRVVPTVPVQRTEVPVQRQPATAFAAGASKASISRSIMLAGHTRNLPYEDVITAMMAACGYDRQLARATYKANCTKIGIPVQ